jgi:hypothetical protein
VDAKCAFIKLLDRHNQFDRLRYGSKKGGSDRPRAGETILHPFWPGRAKGWEEMAVRDQLRQASKSDITRG